VETAGSNEPVTGRTFQLGDEAPVVGRDRAQTGAPRSRKPSRRNKARTRASTELNREAVIVMFDYAPRANDELKLVAGETVTVLAKYDDGWWLGRCGKRQGAFPSNYVKLERGSRSNRKTICWVVVEHAYQAQRRRELTLDVGDRIRVFRKNQSGWWKGENRARYEF